MRQQSLATVFLMLAALGWSAETPARENHMLHRDGARVVDGSGRPVQLRGVNLGGWLLWEPWMWGGHLLASESKLTERLAGITGEAEMARFRQDVYSNFITEADIRQIAQLGFNVVRVPFNHSIFDRQDAGWQILDQLLGWADKYHVYVILDLHAAPGGQARVFTSDPGPDLLWDSEENKSQTVVLWKTIAQRYRDRTIVAGYDLLNEPNPKKSEDLVEMYQKIIAAVREVDPSHMVFLEGTKFASNFSMFSRLLSENQAYSFHMYTWGRDDREQRLAEYRRLSTGQNVPIWNGEFGENNYDMIASTLRLFETPANGLSGWAFWPWKKTANSKGCLMEIRTTPAWQHVIERTSSPLGLGKPSRAETLAAMREFTQSIREEHNVEDPKMMAILTSYLKR